MDIPMSTLAVEAANFAMQAETQVQTQIAQEQEVRQVSWRQRMAAALGVVALPLVANCAAQPAMSDAAFERVVAINTNTMGLSDEALGRLTFCESGNNPKAISKNRKYEGLGQFDRRTWAGTANGVAQLPEYAQVAPSAAPPEVQKAMIRALYSARGRSPWPVCGRRI